MNTRGPILAAALAAAFVFSGGGALAQTNTPTATPTLTPTPTATNTPTPTFTPLVRTPVAVATATPLPQTIRLFEGPSQQKGNLVLTEGAPVIAPPADGGNAGTFYGYTGPVKQSCVTVGTMTNGTTAGVLLLDDSPTGEWSAVNSDTTLSADTSTYRVGTHSLKVAFGANSAAGDGATRSISSLDWTADKSIGFWVYASEFIAAGDFILVVKDATQDTQYQLPAVGAKSWQWVEVDITDLTGTRGDAVTGVQLLLTSQGATAHKGAFSVYYDFMYKWKATDEEALSLNSVAYHIVQDGVYSYWTLTTSSPTGTSVDLIPYVDYFPAYRAAGDVLVTMTDQSANSGRACFAYH